MPSSHQLPAASSSAVPEINDTQDYRVWHAATGNAQQVAQGKYLVRDDGSLAYLVDPSINGLTNNADNGQEVQKFDAPKNAVDGSDHRRHSRIVASSLDARVDRPLSSRS
ncbi:MAG: hypothetical protein U0872_15590 [Planctomycetaceae bacterium]